MKKANKKGFTIVELVIVIAVIAILAAVLIPTFSNVVDKANQSKALQEVRSAYITTIADELATPETTDDTIGNLVKAGAIIVSHNNKLVKINTDGSCEIVTTGDAGYVINNDGKIAAKSGS